MDSKILCQDKEIYLYLIEETRDRQIYATTSRVFHSLGLTVSFTLCVREAASE